MKYIFSLLIFIPSISLAKTIKEIISFEQDCIKAVQSMNHSVSCKNVSKEQVNYFLQISKIHSNNPYCKTLATSNFSAKKVALFEYRAKKCLKGE